MPAKLPTTISKIVDVPNRTNAALIEDFHRYMKSNSSSENHQNNNLKVVIGFAKFLGPNTSFYQLERKEQVIAFLDTKIKNQEQDPEKRWITTWNHYLRRIKSFLRWLYNSRLKNGTADDVDDGASSIDWETPSFAKIKEKRTKRLSPHLETEIWDKEELLSIMKYEGIQCI